MNIIFICQKGQLEIESILLAWSLRNTLSQKINLIAACPRHADWAELSDSTLKALNFLEVKFAFFDAPFGSFYPIGNKIAALGLLDDKQESCFLDSDILSIEDWETPHDLKDYTHVVKPAHRGTWGSELEWKELYNFFNLVESSKRVELTISKKISYPYFNSGVIFTQTPKTLSTSWMHHAQLLMGENQKFKKLYPWLDQITLPFALENTGSWATINEYYNFPAHARPIGDNKIGLCHYNRPGVILRETRLMDFCQSAFTQLSQLNELAYNFKEWKVLSSKFRSRKGLKAKNFDVCKNFIITGIPRSGTSLVSSVIGSQKDVLVLNEPKEAFLRLSQLPSFEGLELLHKDYLEKIILEEPITNKFTNSKLTTDTAKEHSIKDYNPEVNIENFCLGSKNTLLYLANLKSFTKLSWPIIVMVRHPLDVLVSWRNSFPHLREALPSQMRVSNPDYPAWSSRQREELKNLESQSPDVRRVLFWRLLARTILELRDNIIIWKYEDFVLKSELYLNNFMQELKHENNDMRIDKYALSNHRKDHSPKDRELLVELCSSEIFELGYAI